MNKFIMRFEQGYDNNTVVGKHSVTLSGGHKQTIAIARQYWRILSMQLVWCMIDYQWCRVFVLDEATSSLDRYRIWTESTTSSLCCDTCTTGYYPIHSRVFLATNVIGHCTPTCDSQRCRCDICDESWRDCLNRKSWTAIKGCIGSTSKARYTPCSCLVQSTGMIYSFHVFCSLWC